MRVGQATSPARPFDIVFVHSLSRYSRKMLGSEQGFEILESVGVKVSSLTEMIEGDEGWLARSIIAMFSEQSSRETSKHVTRTRRENALQGFWNGGTPPLGLKAVAVDQDFGRKTKKRLAEDEQWSPTVRLIFKLHREGDGEGHPLGTVGIASYLNANKVPTRTGTLWHVSQVHRILTNEAYVGRVYMNRVNRRTGADGKLSETATVRHMQLEMETEQDRLRTLVRLRTAKMKSELKPLDLEQAERLSSQLRQNLLLAPVEISRRYVRALVGRVDVGPGEVIIQGESQTLAGAAANAGADFTGVHSSEREWRTEREFHFLENSKT